MPSNEQLKDAYSEQYYGENKTKFNPIIENFINKMRFKKADRLRKHLKKGAKVLDIGCGDGSFLNYLNNKKQFEINGIELPGKSAERAKEVSNLNLYLGTFEEIDFKDASFDLITIIHVIEHLQFPVIALEKIKKLLKPKGILYIGYPNIDSSQANRYQGNWLHLDPPRHLNFIPPKILLRWCSENNFTLEFENHFSIEYNPYGEIQSKLNTNCSQRDFLFEKLKGNKQLLNNSKEINQLNHYVKACLYFPLALIKSSFEANKKSGACVEYIFKKMAD
jgi:2-polyprenyl-3-methyl-5-hydroxy-6-metoxy-1,4-benzoquinol methylase